MKLDRVKLQTMVRDEADAVKAMLAQLLAKKISYYDDRESVVKRSTPGISATASTTEAVNFVASFKEQLEDLKLELADAPSSDTVRRVKALLSYAKANLGKLDESDVRAVLDSLLTLAGYAVIQVDRAKTKNAEPTATFDKDLTKKSNAGKSSDIRRYVQDIVIKGVYELASQFLKTFDYPQSYEELRDYFDYNKNGKRLAKAIVKAKQDITDRRERRIEQAEDDAHARAVALAQEAEARDQLAEELDAKEAEYVAKVRGRMDADDAVFFGILGSDEKAVFAMIEFLVSNNGVTYEQASKSLDHNLHDVIEQMKLYAKEHKIPFDKFRALAKDGKEGLVKELLSNPDKSESSKRFLFEQKDSIILRCAPADIQARYEAVKNETRANLRAFLQDNLDRNAGMVNRVYGKYATTMNKGELLKVMMIENQFPADDDVELVAPAL